MANSLLTGLRRSLEDSLQSSGPSVMMALGPIRFGVSTQEYESLSTAMSWRWIEKERYLREPAQQFQGKGSTTKNLKIVIVAEYGKDLDFLPAVEAEADAGKPFRLMAGHSRPVGGASVVAAASDLGLWVITSLDVNESEFMRDGTAILYDATMTIKKYGEDRV
ncbi:MAG: phage tail protein [Aeromonas sobria]|uniref:phage tail protein n=1 Tax=Aeromonas sobria TaxID=646 RepID=UPI003F30E0F2